MAFHKILCATDLSEAADLALRAADREARLHDARLAVLHALPGPVAGAPMLPETLERKLVQHEKVAAQAITAVLEQVRRATGRGPDEVEVLVEEGPPAPVILRTRGQAGADLVVVGAARVTGLRRLLLGSVAEKVVRDAPVSVLVARPGNETGDIIVATDFGHPSDAAVRAAAEEARRRGASITVMHSIEFLAPDIAIGDPVAVPVVPIAAVPVEELRASAQKRLAETLAEMGVDGQIELTDGPAGRSIVELAESHGADLIVVGTSGRTGIDRLLLGSVALGVVRDAPCSVLVVRERPRPRRKAAARPASPATI